MAPLAEEPQHGGQHPIADGRSDGRAPLLVSYGLPAFRLNDRPLVAFRAAKAHCAIYPMSPDVIRALADELSDYDVSKGTIRFPIDAPLAAALVKRIVKLRAAELVPMTTRRSTGARRAASPARTGSRPRA